ncbi:MAG: AEC family transporter [Roseburia sp.]|nr:AEC family transporter [Anaeroplasma bactoclasticum]MCM1197129.1 AEC family transporter [Roseburia sp.]MCM1557029.1 AEC family transporter [Anaeroplasma bactoclasticum]
MDNLLFTLNAILPIILPILLGYFLKRLHFFKEEFLTEANKLVFKILIPILLFSNLYLSDLSKINWGFVGFAAAAILILFFVGMGVVLFIPNRKQKGVILQACFRSNYAIIGIPLATMLGGEAAGAEASVIAAVSVPLFNILAVIALSIYDRDENTKISIKDILFKIITNPLIIGVLAGLAVCGINMGINASGGNVNSFLNAYLKFIPDTITSLAKVATPLALLVLGGRFEFKAVKNLWKQLTISVTLRLVITPAIFLVIAYFLGFNGSTQFSILIALFATPIAVSSAPMAAQMGQDEELAGQIVVWTSALSAFSLFAIIMICAAIGIF